MQFTELTFHQAELILQQLDEKKRYEDLKGMVPSESSNKRCISIGMDQGEHTIVFFRAYLGVTNVNICAMNTH